jgi:NADPH-dependent glutamate synthase beta subunit-like oxidoreductase
LKRFAAENDREKLWARNVKKKAATGKKVAVIGAGRPSVSRVY